MGRFAQADSIVPGSGNPLAWDRYAYTLNNPVRFIDPSGHETCIDECGDLYVMDPLTYLKNYISKKFGVTLSDDIKAWTAKSARAVSSALQKMQAKLGINIKSWIGGSTFLHGGNDPGKYLGETSTSGFQITFYFNDNNKGAPPIQNVLHEIGHLLDYRYNDYFEKKIKNTSLYADDGSFVMGNRNGTYNRNSRGYASSEINDPNWGTVDAEQHPGTVDAADDEWGQAGNTPGEEWADLFANYTSDNFSSDPIGIARNDWVTSTLLDFSALPYGAK